MPPLEGTRALRLPVRSFHLARLALRGSGGGELHAWRAEVVGHQRESTPEDESLPGGLAAL